MEEFHLLFSIKYHLFIGRENMGLFFGTTILKYPKVKTKRRQGYPLHILQNMNNTLQKNCLLTNK